MKLTLTIFLIGLLIATFGFGAYINATIKVPDPRRPTVSIAKHPDAAGFGAALTLLGVGISTSAIIILSRRKHNK